MGFAPADGHHRRRSSALAGPVNSTPTDARDDNNRSIADGNGSKRDEQKPLTTTAEEPDGSDLSSIAESVEMDYMSTDDDLHDDEETGLTAKQKRQRRRRREQRRQLDARIANVKASRQDTFGMNLQDRDILKKLLINVGLILLWYFFSLAISIVSIPTTILEPLRHPLTRQYNKWMFSENEVVFPFPLFTTSLHMAVQFTLSALLLYLIPSLRPRNPSADTPTGDYDQPEPAPVLTKFFYLTRLVPCGGATSLDIGLGNMSLKFISLTFLTMCKSSALAFVLLFAFIFRLESPSVKLIVIIATMTIGVVMMVAGETAFNAVGFTLVIASAFFSGFRWGLTQILLLRHPATSNPFSTLFFLTPVMFLSLIVIALAVEGPTEIGNGFQSFASVHGPMLGVMLLIFPGILAFCMISSEFALLKRSSVVTLSICGIFKEVVTISAAGVVFHDQLTYVNVAGLFITISSIASYNYMKITKMRREASKGTWTSPDDSETEESRPMMNGRHDEYHRIAPPETSMASRAPNRHSEHDVNITPSDEMAATRQFPARASGSSRGVQGLTISTSDLQDQDGPTPPRLANNSPLKSAPPPDWDRDRGLSPAQFNPTASPARSSPGLGH